MIWPPITMATQHPDNACSPWWKEGAFVSTPEEIDELLILFKELPIDEYMWDWEGKYVDEAVGEKLFSRAHEFFSQKTLGDDLHLTYRIPAFSEGKMHRMARAFMNVLSLADLGRELHLPRPPVTEMFLPLTTSADQPIAVRKAFREIADYHRAVFHQSKEQEESVLQQFEVTPLVEDSESLFNIADIVGPYWEQLKKDKHDLSRGQRLFLARSDPALNAGLVPAILAVRAALSSANDVGERLGFPVHPIIGTGSLPFRGGVNPRRIESIVQAYAGVRTYSIQSAFRYDYPKQEVTEALTYLKREAPKREAVKVSEDERKKMAALCAKFASHWKPTIEAIADTINAAAAHTPPRRERLQHIGLFGYSRGVGAVKLPRAIGFTAALYSLGVPPELIATGRGLKAAKQSGDMPLIEKHYPTLREDMLEAGYYLNRENVGLLAKKNKAFALIEEDLQAIETLLDIRLGPIEVPHILHRNLSSTIFHRLHAATVDAAALSKDITEAAVLRKSIG